MQKGIYCYRYGITSAARTGWRRSSRKPATTTCTYTCTACTTATFNVLQLTTLRPRDVVPARAIMLLERVENRDSDMLARSAVRSRKKAWWVTPTRFQTVFVSRVATASRSFQTVRGTVRLTRSRTGVARAFPCGTASEWTALALSHCSGVTARTVVTSCRLIQQPTWGWSLVLPGEQCSSNIHGKFRSCRYGCS
jgi:hypothetical protein